jgi:hypothetical protein
MADTETIDRLFLELSQFTRAKTARELELERAITAAFGLLWHAAYDTDNKKVSEARSLLKTALDNAGRERGINIAITRYGHPNPR